MEKIINSNKDISVKDIPCSQCMKCKSLFGLYGDGYCVRLCMDCDKARPICEKSQWYVEMCTMNAILDSTLK